MFHALFNNSLVWFEGVVEDIKDPLKLGRVKIRCFGYHIDKKSEIPTDDLHWAQVMHPVTSAAMNGIGHSPALLQGTHVIGFFRDGQNAQDPVVMGSIGGLPQEAPSPSKGFNDPDGVYPKEEFLDEPDTSRHSREEDAFLDPDNDLTPKKRNQRIGEDTSEAIEGVPPAEPFLEKEFPTADIPTDPEAIELMDQPEIPYAAEYPFNRVHETESGHVIEYDDTPGAERICITHRTGSFIEMHPDGTVTMKSVNENYKLVQADNKEIMLSNNTIHIEDDYNLHVGGNFNVLIDGDVNWRTQGNWNQHTELVTTQLQVGDVFETLNSNHTRVVDLETNITQTGNVTKTLGSNYIRDITGTNTQTVGGSVSLTHNADYSHNVSSTIDTIAGAVQTIQGSQVLIN